MSVAGSISPTTPGSTKELRLGIVFYGGVSLAMYMHGVTKELHRLVAASVALNEDPEHNPYSTTKVEHTYWNILKSLEQKDHYRTRVVIDLIAGTSAGGINGIALAKALSHNLSQEPRRKVWMEQTDIKKLMGGIQFIPAKLKLVGFFARLVRHLGNPPPPLGGDRMFGWIHQALNEMDQHGGFVPNVDSMVPPGQSLELFVTLTDMRGYHLYFPAYVPRLVSNLRHRHVLNFRYQSEQQDQFGGNYNPALTFAARATSSFPGAFPPIRISNIAKNAGDNWPGREGFKKEFFRSYELAGENEENSYFVDGGVLDNYPFGYVTNAIAEKPASLRVDRKLIYIEPDPKEISTTSRQEMPTWLGTVWAGLSGIPSHEPIIDDLLRLREHNERVSRVNTVINGAFPEVSRLLNEIRKTGVFPADASPDQVLGWREEINAKARQMAGFSHSSYTKLKLYNVVERLGDLVSIVRDFPEDSNHRAFVRDVFIRWADDKGIFADDTEGSQARIEFLKPFDLSYSRRRIRFVIRGINAMYERSNDPRIPTRAQLDVAKTDLYKFMGELSPETTATDITEEIKEFISVLFADAKLAELISKGPSEQDAFKTEWVAALNRLEDMLSRFFEERLANHRQDLYQMFHRVTADWDRTVREELMVRYLGFPFWDILLFPVVSLSEAGEMDEVEVLRMSPVDSKLLEPMPDTPKLRGVALGHFGAFFDRKYRENDYLWGRLDAAERLIHTLLGVSDQSQFKAAFEAIMNEERPNAHYIRDVYEHLDREIANL